MTLMGFGGAADQAEGGVIRIPATADADVQLTAVDVNIADFHHSAYHLAAGSFIIRGGEIILSGGMDTARPAVGMEIGGGAGNVSGIVEGTAIAVSPTGEEAEDSTAVAIRSNGEVEIRGCTITGVKRGIWADNSRFDGTGHIAVNIHDADVAAVADAVLLSGSAEGEGQTAVDISGGRFQGDLRIADGTERDTLSISGGIFSANPEAYVAPGCQVKLVDGMYAVSLLSSGGSTGGGGQPDTPVPPSPSQPSDPETAGGSTTVSTQVTPTVSGDTAKAEIGAEVMDKTVESVLQAAAESSTAPVVQIIVDSSEASHVEVALPVVSLDTLGRNESSSLTVASHVATITLDSAAITALASQAPGDKITLAVSPVPREKLNEKQQAVVGDAPVFDLHLRSGGVAINHFDGGKATVSLPHTLGEEQEAHGVAVYYLDDEGDVVLRETVYDVQTQTVTFTTPHFSMYVVSYEEPQLVENPFVDVKESDYFYDAILWAVDQEVTFGTSAVTFSPHGVSTRAQAIMFLWRAAGSPVPVGAANPFRDVSRDDLYYHAVLWAVEQGITSGTSKTTFSPEAPCTRAQIVTFLWRFGGSAASYGKPPFADVAEDAYYGEAVLWAAENGITTGTAAGTFSPEALCSRAQTVTFLFRSVEKLQPYGDSLAAVK